VDMVDSFIFPEASEFPRRIAKIILSVEAIS
jgi:hypothetical protein